MVGYTLDNLGLSFNHPAKLLKKLWSSKCIYPLILPLFHNMQHMDTKALIQAWTLNWHLIYQFDHGLKACSTIAITDDPIDHGRDPLTTQPLWMPTTGNNVILLPLDNGTAISLAGEGLATVTGTWAIPTLLLIPEGGTSQFWHTHR